MSFMVGHKFPTTTTSAVMADGSVNDAFSAPAFGKGGYTVGLAISDSGKLASSWRQQAEPLYQKDGGHGMLFTTFDGKLLMVLHSPNNRGAQPHIFELEDTGETLKVIEEFTGK